MFNRNSVFLIVVALVAAASGACTTGGGSNSANANASPAAAAIPKTSGTPAKNLTDVDVAKLKWLTGTWRGVEGQKPFYKGYRFDGSTMLVDSYDDAALKNVTSTSRFELKDGEFGTAVGDSRSAASSITDNSAEFVPAAAPGQPETADVKGTYFKFEKQNDGTWIATLTSPPARGKPASEKVYKMEPWKGDMKEK